MPLASAVPSPRGDAAGEALPLVLVPLADRSRARTSERRKAPAADWGWFAAAGAVLTVVGLYLSLAAAVRDPGAPPSRHPLLAVGAALPAAGLGLLAVRWAAQAVAGRLSHRSEAPAASGRPSRPDAAPCGRDADSDRADAAPPRPDAAPARPRAAPGGTRRFVLAGIGLAGYGLAASAWLGGSG
ncbi:MAG: hypothetical protein DIU76_06670, partial [Bacillota bacterium]